METGVCCLQELRLPWILVFALRSNCTELVCRGKVRGEDAGLEIRCLRNVSACGGEQSVWHIRLCRNASQSRGRQPVVS